MKKFGKLVISSFATMLIAFLLLQPTTGSAQGDCFNGKSRKKSDGTMGCWLWGKECMNGPSCSAEEQ